MKTKLILAAVAVCALVGTAAADEPKKAVSDTQTLVFMGDGRPVILKLNLETGGRSLQAVWDDCVTKIFKHLDGNNDGVLSKDEVERIPPTQVLFGGGNPFGRVRVIGPQPGGPKLEGKDGKVTRDDLAAYLMRTGGMPFRMEFGPQQQFTRAILVAPGMQANTPNSADAINAALFALLDTDKDGKLSKEELAAAPEMLKKLDTDDDEMLSLNELMPGGAAGPGLLLKPVDVITGRPGSPTMDNSQFFLVLSKESGQQLAQQLLSRYGGRNATSLTRKEIGLDEETFAGLDTNRDGSLNATELAQVMELPPDVELRVRLGKRGDKDAPVEVVKKKEKGGLEVKTQGTLLSLALGVSRVELRLGGPEDPGGLRAVTAPPDFEVMQFKMADTDGNGYLDEKEATANPFFRTAFKQMDRDGDGKLYEKEVKEYLASIKEIQTAAKEGTAVLNVSDQGRGLFDLLDTRRDGKLGLRELREAVKLLDKLDRDGDGRLGLNEVPKNYQMAFDQGGGSGNGIFAVAFTADGRVPDRVPELTAGPMWFRKMDRNRDGDVSRREFLGTDEEFGKIDTDRDGLISVEEAEKFDASRRK